MMQIPNLPNPYMVPQQSPYMTMPQTMPQQDYNAVKIDIHNPQVNAPGAAAPQYAPVTAPYYNYPQAALYSYPQAQAPCYMPSVMPQQAPMIQMAPQAPIMVPPAVEQAPAPQVQVPEPVVTQPAPAPAPAQEVQKPEVVPPEPVAPQIDLNALISKLTNPDYDVQASTMEEMAGLVKDNPQAATELLDTKVIDALTNIMKADSSKLAGPTQEQITARQKLMSGEKISDAEKQLATTLTPMEQAERNKSYAMFTSAILQKLYGDEVAKLTNTTVPLTELPGAVTIVEELKNNPSPMVRTSAIEALSYIQQPAYAKDLNTIFSIAKTDSDKGVQEAATAALERLSQLPQEQQPAAQPTPAAQPQQPEAQPAQPEAKTVQMTPQQPAAQAA